MPPVVVPADAPMAFATAAALEAWYSHKHNKATELWILLAKKGSGVPSVTSEEALDIALCWGWIDTVRKPFDSSHFLQRYTPRGKRSIWSVKNRDNVERLIAAGRMTPFGQSAIDAAKADGRWDRAYEGSARMAFPPELLSAIEDDPAALDTFTTLSAQNRFALAFRYTNLKTEAARLRKIETFVDMLRRGETIYPNGKGK